jgi:CheY-like chemotaxis protein
MSEEGVRQQNKGDADGATILLVEDGEALRSMARIFLERNGYSVIEAENGTEALAIWETEQGQIDLVVTDLVMPNGLAGQQLARRLQLDRPELKIIFTSGYDREVFTETGSGLLDPASNFLQKPYRLSRLAEMIRESLTLETAA